MEKKNNRKVLSAIGLALSVIIFGMALAVFIVTMTARSQNKTVVLFGYSFAIVATDSMYPEIKAGDLIVVKTCRITEVEEGQNAVFVGLNGDYKGKNIVHRVIEKHTVTDESGNALGIELITKGINNSIADADPVTASNFLGKEVYHSSALGGIVRFLQNPVNWLFMVIFVAAVWIAITQIVKIVKTKKSDKESKE